MAIDTGFVTAESFDGSLLLLLLVLVFVVCSKTFSERAYHVVSCRGPGARRRRRQREEAEQKAEQFWMVDQIPYAGTSPTLNHNASFSSMVADPNASMNTTTTSMDREGVKIRRISKAERPSEVGNSEIAKPDEDDIESIRLISTTPSVKVERIQKGTQRQVKSHADREKLDESILDPSNQSLNLSRSENTFLNEDGTSLDRSFTNVAVRKVKKPMIEGSEAIERIPVGTPRIVSVSRVRK